MKIRTTCKICKQPLSLEIPKLISFEIEYFECNNCKHLCGKFDDEGEYSDYLYLVNSGSTYAERYEVDYETRVEKIYLPKVDFLLDAIGKAGEIDSGRVSVLDVGAGGGHFLRALEVRGVPAEGIEVNAEMVKHANHKLIKSKVTQISIGEAESKILEAKASVISMIGVLEHVNSPIEIFEKFAASDAKYLYISVPMLSLAALLQPLNEEVFPRQLSVDHTHVFTEKSLEFLLSSCGLRKIAAWWFGSDMIDLFRMLSVIKNSEGKSKINSSLLQEYLQPVLDEMQNVLDKSKLCSELHLVIGK
jgi:SAM-dependent methyltransferase